MKKIIPILFIVFSVMGGHAQTKSFYAQHNPRPNSYRYIPTRYDGFYIKLHGGYNWPGFQNNDVVMAPNVSAQSTTSDGLVAMANMDDSLKSYRQVHHSYAAGANISFGVGYMVNRWFGVELGVHYLWNSKATSFVRSDMTSIGFAGQFLSADITTYSKHGLSITPLLVFVAPIKASKFQPQAKIGLVLPVYGRVYHEVEINSPLSIPVDPFFVGNKTSVVMNTESTFSIGITGAVGLRYTPIPFITVFADMTGQWLNIRAKKTEITKWEAHDNATGNTYDMINGDPNSPDYSLRPTYRKEFEYVDELNSTSNNAEYNSNYDPNKPKQDARITAPASNIGFQIGIQFNLGKDALNSIK